MSESCNCGLEATGIYKQGDTYVFISKVPNKLIRYCLRLYRLENFKSLVVELIAVLLKLAILLSLHIY